ncbi:MAG: amidohydrolase family protein [Acidimicrobiales bacterium]
MDLVLSGARLGDGSQVDIGVTGGLISSVTAAGTSAHPDAVAHDLGGWLLLPAMAEPHAHLDKALTAEKVPNPAADLLGAIEAWTAAADAGMFTHADIVERAVRAMELLLVHGVTVVRTHVNVGSEVGVAAVVALQEARARLDGLLDVQLVALTHCPMTGPEGAGNRAALAEALEVGVDLVGGCPHLDPDGAELIRHALAAATEAGLGVDLHVDETLDPTVSNLREFARQVRDIGFEHPVAASHCVSLGMQPPEVQTEIAREVAEAGIAVFPLPQTNLYLQSRDRPSGTPRGLTAVTALQEAGVLVAAGADNVQDPFNLVGRSDPLETAALMVLAGHQRPEAAYGMVSNEVREAIGLARVEIEVGDPADLLAIDAPSVRGAVADAPMSRRVYRRGVLVGSCDHSETVHRDP